MADFNADGSALPEVRKRVLRTTGAEARWQVVTVMINRFTTRCGAQRRRDSPSPRIAIRR